MEHAEKDSYAGSRPCIENSEQLATLVSSL